jgi:UDP-2,3-diacylglucosamine pyrophosphatase LpxH
LDDDLFFLNLPNFIKQPFKLHLKPSYNHLDQAMSEAKTRVYVFLSDLHLGSGFDPLKGSYSLGENFFYDDQFARFLAFLQRRAQEEGQALQLVLLGDIFDFLRAEHPRRTQPDYSLDSSPGAAVEKLERIAAGHSRFFEALGRLLEAGFQLAFLPGNHDIEMLHAAVQEKVRKLIRQYGHCSAEAADAVQFLHWIYYVPGVFYAEHGQQQHWINGYPDLPLLINQEVRGRIPLPAGSHFEIYQRGQSKQNGKGRNRMRFLCALLSASSHASSPLENSRRRAALQNALPLLSSQTGLSSQTITALAQDWPKFDLPQMLKQLVARISGKPPKNYLYQAAATIHKLLMSSKEQVPYYVFGHSHKPAMQPLPDGTPTAYYINGGSWSGEHDNPHSAPIEPTPNGLLPFILITSGPGESNVEARILTWDDSAGRLVLP